jgi:hypothetical protein
MDKTDAAEGWEAVVFPVAPERDRDEDEEAVNDERGGVV